MAVFTWLYRYFWLIAIAIGCINHLILWARLQRRMQENPELVPGYITLLRGYWFYNTFLWIVMGIGILFGDVPNVFYYLHPRLGNEYILVWWGSLWLMNGYLTIWMLWGGGAEMLIAHPGFLRSQPTSAKRLKFYWLLMLAGSVAVTIALFSQTSTDILLLPLVQ